MSQSDSVRSVDQAREFPASAHGDRTLAFDQQTLIPEEHRRSNDTLLASLDRNRNEFSDAGTPGGLEVVAAVSHGDAVAETMKPEREQAVGRIETVTGSVTIVRADGTISEAYSGDLVHRGDAIQAGRGSSAAIGFLDGTSVDVSADSRMTIDGTLSSAWPAPVQLALSGVSVDDETIKPFGVFDLLEGSRVVETVDNPDNIVEMRRTPSGELSVTRSSADPAAQAQHYEDALRVQNLGQQYGINSNGRGSGSSPEPLLQRINFTDDLPDSLQLPSVDPLGPRASPGGQVAPDFFFVIPPRTEFQRAALTPAPVTGPTYADTVTLDHFDAVTGTLTATGAGAGVILTYGIEGGVTGSPTVLDGVRYDVSRSGPFGVLHVNSSTGAYALVPDDAAINALTADRTATFTVTVSDGTRLVSQAFKIVLHGENDSPLLSPVTGSTYADTVTLDTFDALTGTLQATDVDAGTRLKYGVEGGTRAGTVVNGTSYDVARSGTYGTLYVNSATGDHTFVPDDKAINALIADTRETFTVTVSDGALADSRSFTVTLNGENDKPLLSPVTGAALADTHACDDFAAVAGVLQATDADAGTTLTYGIDGATTCGPTVLHGVSYDLSRSGSYGTLYVNSETGAYKFVPDDAAVNALSGDTTETFTVTVSDGALMDSRPFTVAINGENDKPLLAPVIGPAYADTSACDDFAAVTGVLQGTDADAGTTLTFGIDGATSCGPTVLHGVSYDLSRSGSYGTLYVNSETGAYTFVPDDAAVNALCGDTTETFTVTVSDGALVDSRPFTVALDGENDKPLLAPVNGPTYTDTHACDDFAAVTGVLQGTDADAGAMLTYGIDGASPCGPTVLHGVSYDVSRSGDYGTLYVNSDTGAYKFVPDDAAINALCGDTTETFTVTVSDGALVDSQCFTVTLDDKHDGSGTTAGVEGGEAGDVWVAGFVASGRDGDQLALAGDAAGAEPTTINNSPVAAEEQDSFLFERPAALGQQPSASVEVQTATGADEGQQGAGDTASDAPVFEFMDLTSGIDRPHHAALQDHFILQP